MTVPETAGGRGPDAAWDAMPLGDGIVRVDVLTHIPSVLRELGLDPAAVIAESGLDPGIFDDPANEVPMWTLGRLLQIAATSSGCAHVGLLIGQRSRALGAMGLVGRLVWNSPDLGTALRNLTGHLHLRDRGAVAPLLVSDGVASLGYEIYQPNVEACDQICDLVMAIASKIVRSLCGPIWRPHEVLFAHREPADPRPLHRFFGVPLRFDAGSTAVLFPAQWLEHPIEGADPIDFRELSRRVDALERRMTGELVSDLRPMLRVILMSGMRSVDELAERLSRHRRTLNRRLRAHGTSLHRMIEEVRSEMARQLVENTRMSLTDIAATLGYSEPSAFTRAFRRWKGKSPKAWRNDHGAGARRQAASGPAAYARRARPRRAAQARWP
jgi:AraC-like DNA-binding protein